MWGESPVSLRRFMALCQNLPMHGAVGRKLGALEAQNWKHGEELLAAIAELIHDNTSTLILANSKKGTAKRKPLRIERPPLFGIKRKQRPRRKATSEDLKRIFGDRIRSVTAEPSEERAE